MSLSLNRKIHGPSHVFSELMEERWAGIVTARELDLVSDVP
jgi:hypothetical protein